MQLEWIYYPITQYTVTAVGLISSLALWASAKAEIRRVRRIVKTSIAQFETGVTNLNASLDDVRKTHTIAPEPEPEPVPAHPPFLQGLNLTKRTQILRMKRRGESLHSIAAALQLPLGEVTLILKMESLQAPAAETAPRAAAAAVRGIL